MNAWIRRVGSFGRAASDLTTDPLCSPLYLSFGFDYFFCCCLVGFGLEFFVYLVFLRQGLACLSSVC